MANKAPAIASKTVHYKYVDGIEIDIVGSDTVATRQLAYQKAHDLANSIKPPIIIVSPTNGVKEISYDDFCKLSDVEGQSFKVKAGIYGKGADHSNLKNVSVDLSGIQVANAGYAINIHDKSVNVSYNGLSTKNISGYQVNCVGADKVVYNGVEGTFIDKLKINGFTFDGGGRPFHSDGNVRSKGVHDGVLKGFVFSNNTIKNNLGSKFMVYLGNGFDFDIFGNTFENINKQNNEDNGMFYLKATGKIHDNKASNYQGYLARIWPHSIGERRTVEVYNNIGIDGDKYGLIELQFPSDFIGRGAEPADAKVYNNTALNLNKTTDWAGELLTLYNTFGQVEFYNNLGATLVGYDGGKSTRDYNVINGNNMVFGQFDKNVTKLIVSGQNIYKNTKEEVVNSDLSSKFKGVGAF